MPFKTRDLRNRRWTRPEIINGVGYLLLIVLMTILAIYLNLWLLKHEEEPREKNTKPAVTVTGSLIAYTHIEIEVFPMKKALSGFMSLIA